MKQFDITYFHGPFAEYVVREEVIADIAASGMTLMPHGGGTRLSGRIRLDTVTAGQLQTEMVTAMKVGEAIARSEDSPSLLLQRVGEEDLWQLAKASGSTVEAIREANGLENEPIPGALLLIPVI